MSSMAIGIDLGTTNSCVGVMRNGQVEIIANRPGNRLTPSCVAFSGDELLVGDAAKTQAALNPHNTVYDIKRLMGRKFADMEVQKLMDLWPFQIKNSCGNPTVEVEFKNVQKRFSPEELSARILIDIKETAEDFIGSTVTEAVITVPAYFNDSQRQATIDAGKIAGLKVLALINEPTAAAIAYGFAQTDADRRNVLIFDLGGGTLDVALLTIQNGNIEVEAVSGDTFLGGGDFDNRLMEYFMKKFNEKHDLDMSQNPRALGRLRTACEKTKCNLSFSIREDIIVECLFQGTDLVFSIERSKFEDLCKKMFTKTLQPVETVLKDAGFDKSEVDEVILVGGSTRIPYIQSLLQEFFDDKKLNMTINPVEAVACGAALHAAALTGSTGRRIVTLQDVCPMSLGIDVLGGYTSKVIRKNTKIPVKKTMKYNTTTDGQTAVDIKVYEGEHDFSAQNNILGEFSLEGIFPAPKGTVSVDVTFALNRNGVTTITAVDPTSGIFNFISVTAEKGRLDDSSLHRMIEEAKSF